jgi:beta-glucanase (GH16 family)
MAPRSLLASALLLASPALSLSSSFCDLSALPSSWSLNWEDDFSGDSLDLSSWSIQVGNNGRNIGSCRDAYCSPDNVVVANGTLILSSKAEAVNGYNFTTGAVTTQGKRDWTHAPTFRLCASAMLPGGGGGGKGAGIWPAIWMMPDDSSCDPDEGEMDILEMVDGDGTAWSTYHFQTTYPKQNCSYPTGHEERYAQTALPADWATTFHEFSVERGATHLAYAIDGVVVLNTSSSDPAPTPLFWPVPFYLIMNTAVGGSWPGNPNSTTVFPAYHVIDSVRVIVQGA